MVATVAQPTTAADVCSVIWKATEVLSTIKRYKKHCNPLKEALLRLHEVLKNVESQRSQEPDVLKSSSLFLDARVSVSKTYLIVEGMATYNFMTGPKYWWTICTPCFTDNPNPDRLRTQLAETLKLVDDLSSSFKVVKSGALPALAALSCASFARGGCCDSPPTGFLGAGWETRRLELTRLKTWAGCWSWWFDQVTTCLKSCIIPSSYM